MVRLLLKRIQKKILKSSALALWCGCGYKTAIVPGTQRRKKILPIKSAAK
jgi:hypothetical protein